MVKTKTTAPHLTLVIDFGGSLTKVIYQGDDSQPKLLTMEPEVISLNKEVLEGYEARRLGSPDAVNSAWVGCDSDYYAVGYLARSQFYGNAGLSSHKYERAFAKTLAAVWVVAKLLGLTKKREFLRRSPCCYPQESLKMLLSSKKTLLMDLKSLLHPLAQ